MREIHSHTVGSVFKVAIVVASSDRRLYHSCKVGVEEKRKKVVDPREETRKVEMRVLERVRTDRMRQLCQVSALPYHVT